MSLGTISTWALWTSCLHRQTFLRLKVVAYTKQHPPFARVSHRSDIITFGSDSHENHDRIIFSPLKPVSANDLVLQQPQGAKRMRPSLAVDTAGTKPEPETGLGWGLGLRVCLQMGSSFFGSFLGLVPNVVCGFQGKPKGLPPFWGLRRKKKTPPSQTMSEPFRHPSWNSIPMNP